MSKVMTFSRTFPAHHPKAGQPTWFVEKIVSSFDSLKIPKDKDFSIEPYANIFNWDFYLECKDHKHQTIRAGSRFKVGDYFSPRVWSGKPYNSKQIIIAPDIEVKKVWDFEMVPSLFIDECKFLLNKKEIDKKMFCDIAVNDGLTPLDFIQWFSQGSYASSKRKPFVGQVICWNENINY